MTMNPIEQFLSGQAPTAGRAPVSDSRELLMDKLDDILETSIADLTQARTEDLLNAMPSVIEQLEREVVSNSTLKEYDFTGVTTRAVQLMGLVIAVYAQALEVEYEREPMDDEDEEVSDST